MITVRSDVTVQLTAWQGTDADIAAAARVSTGTTSEQFEGLLRYLMREKHGSPFEHTSLTFYVEAPIFVTREMLRHRAGFSFNETSGRYRELEPVFYVPAQERPIVQVGKPADYELLPGNEFQKTLVQTQHVEAFEKSWLAYRNMLQLGVAREVARNVLPTGIFSSIYVTCNTRSLMHFLSLRTRGSGSKPLHEIEMVAQKMEQHFAEQFPVTYKMFNEMGRIAP